VAKETPANHPIDIHESNELSKEITIVAPESTHPASGNLSEQENEVIGTQKHLKPTGTTQGQKEI